MAFSGLQVVTVASVIILTAGAPNIDPELTCAVYDIVKLSPEKHLGEACAKVWENFLAGRDDPYTKAICDAHLIGQWTDLKAVCDAIAIVKWGANGIDSEDRLSWISKAPIAETKDLYDRVRVVLEKYTSHSV